MKAPAPPIHADDPDIVRLASEGRVVAYFGYGSLVNRDTLRTRFLAIRRARVVGWRRFWLPRPAVGLALLSVRAEEGASVDGVVVYDLVENLAAVDEREANYGRRAVPPGALVVDGEAPADPPVFIYEAIRGDRTATESASAVLQSYLDAVMQGFLAVHGEDGLRRFVAETDGFETAVIRDRAAPRYPRSVWLAPAEAALFDDLLLARGVRFRDE